MLTFSSAADWRNFLACSICCDEVRAVALLVLIISRTLRLAWERAAESGGGDLLGGSTEKESPQPSAMREKTSKRRRDISKISGYEERAREYMGMAPGNLKFAVTERVAAEALCGFRTGAD